MHNPDQTLDPTLRKHLRRLRFRTGLSLWAEEILKQFWPLFYWMSLYAVIVLTGNLIFQIDTYVTQFMAFVFYTGCGVFLINGLRHFHRPRQKDIDGRLENTPQVKHTPLSALSDSLANDGSPQTEQLWQTRLRDVFDRLKYLRAQGPKAVLTTKDPYSFHIALIVLLVILVVVKGPEQSLSSLRGSLQPFDFAEIQTDAPEKTQIVITPPAYTQLGNMTVIGSQPHGAAALEIPDGSTYSVTTPVKWFHHFIPPKLTIDETSYILEQNDNPVFEKEDILPAGRMLTVGVPFHQDLAFGYRLKTDTPPEITLNGVPEIESRGGLAFPLLLKDDYGVEKIQVRVDLTDQTSRPLIGETYDVIEDIRTQGGPDPVEQRISFDLTAHPWAGHDARITLIAADAPGQVDILSGIEVRLPERVFQNEIARKLIDLRKTLIAEPNSSASTVQTGLIDIIERPANYNGDKVMFLGLSTAIYRLQYSPGLDSAKALVNLLWDLAIHLEDGATGKSYIALEEARDALENALTDPNSTPEEIQARMQEFQRAMAAYFRDLARQMAQRMAQQMQNMPPSSNMQMMAEALQNMITPQDIMEFIEEMQRQIEAGNTDAVREMLERLSDITQALQPGAMSAEMPQDIQDMQKYLQTLQEITQDQKDLRYALQNRMDGDEDFRRQQRNLEILKTIPGLQNMLGTLRPEVRDKLESFEAPQISMQTGGEADTQEQIRSALGDLMTDIGTNMAAIPENLGTAERFMNDAQQNLLRNAPAPALEAQNSAIDALEDTQNQMRQQMMQRMAQMIGIGFMGGMPQLDPLGRPREDDNGERFNPLLGKPVKIPEEGERRLVDDILETLRNRSGELSRPQEERHYFERLLDRF